nr:MAG TPA: hypothetical protein [Bacteriophage sp.]
MSVKFMSGEKSSKFTIPENEIGIVSDKVTEISNTFQQDIENIKLQIDLEKHIRENDDNKNFAEIQRINSEISDIYHRTEPIFNLLAIIVTSRLFMFINKFTCYVGYKLFSETIVVLIPPVGAKKNKLRILNKEFKKEVKDKKLNIDKLKVRFEYMDEWLSKWASDKL